MTDTELLTALVAAIDDWRESMKAYEDMAVSYAEQVAFRRSMKMLERTNAMKAARERTGRAEDVRMGYWRGA